MGFWIYMLIMDLLLPLTMIGFGKYFIKRLCHNKWLIFDEK